jgi:membrane fusion protein
MQGSTLYRQTAIQAHSNQKLGSALLLPKRRVWVVCTALFAWLIAALLFLTHYTFTETVSVRGYITADQPSIAISPKEPAGLAKTIYVKNGDSVQQGQALVTIVRPVHSLMGITANENSLNNLNQQIKLLSLTSEQRKAQLEQQQHHVNLQINAMKEKRKALQNQAKVIDERISLSLAQVRKLESLHARQLISNEALTNAKQSNLIIKQQQTQVELQLSDTLTTLLEYRAQAISLGQQIKQQTTQTQLNQLPLSQQINQRQAQAEYTLYAPRDGVVSNINIQVGEDVSRYLVLMKISPSKPSFSAVLFVPTSSVGFIETEQAIQMRLDAFAYQKYGSIAASVTRIANTVSLPGENQTHPIALQQAAFVTQASLEKTFITAKGERVPLKEGMTLQADVTLSERSLMEWLLAPLYNIRGSI